MINVPVSVINGNSPINTSCSLISSRSLLIKRTRTLKGAEYVASRSLDSSTSYLGVPNL